MNMFTFRTECLHDEQFVVAVMAECGVDKFVSIPLRNSDDHHYTFISDKGLEDMRGIMEGVIDADVDVYPDCHRMYQTLAAGYQPVF